MLLVAGLVFAPAPVTAFGAARSRVTINTTVTTTVPTFEFNAFFGPPSTVISCELDHNVKSPGSKPFSEAYCMSYTKKLTHHVTLSTSGVVKKCVGVQCESNPGLGTPDLSPGTMVKSGPFTCVIAKSAVACTIASGKGFNFTLNAINVI